MLMLILISHAQCQAPEADAPKPAPKAAPNPSPTANNTNSNIKTEGGLELGVPAVSNSKTDKGSVKKDEPRIPETKEGVITEKPIEQKKNEEKIVPENPPTASPKTASLPAESKMPPDEHHLGQSAFNEELDIPGQAFFYVLVGITTTAIILLVVRVYGLRLSRAERKYGVQGDRANEELTPLPMAIEDVNSDEEDHTVFEVNRQNIRIL
uniref:GK21352 n=2 Tax=Drosophila willistoni TaxID=7260 RepID=B4MQZ6_DROWI